MDAAPAPYHVRSGEAERDRETVLAVWRECGATGGPEFVDGARRYDWFYLRNPAGPARVFFLEHTSSGRVVGVVGLGAREFWRDGERARMGLLVDFMVHPDHRIFYPALLLQRFVRQSVASDFDLVFGHPNKGSEAVIRRAGYASVPFHRFARIVNFGASLGRVLPRPVAWLAGVALNAADRIAVALSLGAGPPISCRWVDRLDDRYDGLWPQRAEEGWAIGCRGREFLEWRFFGQPDRQYRVLEITAGGTERLLGYFVCEFDATTLTVADCMLPAEPGVRRAALLHLIRAARHLGLARIYATISCPDTLRRSLAAVAFSQRDEGVLLIIDNCGSARTIDADQRWYFTIADADT